MKINFKEVISTVSKFTDEHKPEIATGAGIALMLGGTVATVVATVKTMKAVSEAKAEKLAAIAPTKEAYDDLSAEDVQRYDEIEASPLPRNEAIAVCWKWWMIPAVTEALGIFCLIFSNRESAKRLASLGAALAYQIGEAKDYRDAAKEILGDEKEEEVDREAARKGAKRRAKYCDEIYDTGTGSELFVDYYSGRRFRASMNYLESCRLELNKKVWYLSNNSTHHYVTLNDWYDILQIPRNDGLGSEFGWDAWDYGGSEPDPTMEITFDYSNRNAYKDENLESNWIVRFGYNTKPVYILDGYDK